MSKIKQTNSLPAGFLSRLTEIVGGGIFQNIEKSFLERPTTFRLNKLKILPGENIKMKLIEQGFKIRQVLWYKDAFILENKSLRELAEASVYKEGKIYVQSLASMAPVLALQPEPGEKVLDLTAAPGSKTSQIAALMERTGELVANDNNQIRWERLQHNMELLGVAGDGQSWKFTLHNEDGWKIAEKYPNYFDKILLDAPCSAEARFVAGDSKTYGY
jgi:16S rRNA (cytosine1407-C5)-methyltransferase